MNLSFSSLLQLARFTLQRPREGAQTVLQMNPTRDVRWTAFVLMAVLSALMTAISLILLPPEMRAVVGTRLPNPLLSAALQGGVLLISVVAIYRVGRWFGGHGSFADALLLLVWLQFILLLVQAAQLVAQVVLPPLSDVIGLLGIALFFWLLTNFIAELHGFASRAAVFAGIVVTTLVLAFALAVLLLPYMTSLPPGI